MKKTYYSCFSKKLYNLQYAIIILYNILFRYGPNNENFTSENQANYKSAIQHVKREYNYRGQSYF